MRKSCLSAILAASVVLTGLTDIDGLAQNPAQNPARRATAPAMRGAPSIALLDVPYIFKNHVRFKAMMNDMKADAARAETQMKAERTAIARLTEKVKGYRKGSPEYKGMAEDVTRRGADLSLKIRLHNDEFREREAGIFFTIYQEIRQQVDYYAANNGITLVLRFNGEPADVNQPESILREINKQVVWYTRDRDITKVILDTLNARGGYRQPGPGTPGGGTARPPRAPQGVQYK